jgi:hypothetical protein
LPHELTLEQNRELLRDYVQELFIKRGMAAQVDIHAPEKGGTVNTAGGGSGGAQRPRCNKGSKILLFCMQEFHGAE